MWRRWVRSRKGAARDRAGPPASVSYTGNPSVSRAAPGGRGRQQRAGGGDVGSGSELHELDASEGDAAGVGLEADVAGRARAGGSAAGGIGVGVVGDGGAVDGHVVGLAVDADLVVVPLSGRVDRQVGGVV